MKTQSKHQYGSIGLAPIKKDIKDAIIRDLQPVKDRQGGRGVMGESKPTTGRAPRHHTCH